MANLHDIFFDLLGEDEVEAAHEIETQGQLRQKITPKPVSYHSRKREGYPSDEAGSLEAIR